MSLLYVEAIGGASGNMLIGAMLDLGYPLAELERELKPLPLPPWSSIHEKVEKRGVAATHFDFRVPSEGGTVTVSELLAVLAGSTLPEAVRTSAAAVFERYRQASGWEEFPLAQGADLLLDIVSFPLLLHRMGLQKMHCAPLPLGTGTVRYHNGLSPNPSPAVLELLRGLPVRVTDIENETVTVTGAALLATLADFRRPPLHRSLQAAYGAGKSDFPVANVVRVQRLEEMPERAHLCVLETRIDDMNPQWIPPLLERLLEAGALDAFTTPILMKKGRPAFLLTILCEETDRERLEAVTFSGAPTLGIRRYPVERTELAREIRSVETPLGKVDVKYRTLPDGSRTFTLEFESCRVLAQSLGRPLPEVSREVQSYLDSRD